MRFRFSASSPKHAERKAHEILRKHMAWGTLINVEPVRGCTYEAEASGTEPEHPKIKVKVEANAPVIPEGAVETVAEAPAPKPKKGTKPKKDAKPKSKKRK
jgi:hypothetical protein